jgi:hypothetical protein
MVKLGEKWWVQVFSILWVWFEKLVPEAQFLITWKKTFRCIPQGAGGFRPFFRLYKRRKKERKEVKVLPIYYLKELCGES